jgi:hypothetical protein
MLELSCRSLSSCLPRFSPELCWPIIISAYTMVRFAESTNVDPRATGPSFRSTAVEQSLASGKSSGNTAGRSYNSRTSKKSNSGKSKLKFQKPDHNLGIPSKARAQFAAQTSVRKATNKLKDTKRLTKVGSSVYTSLQCS